MQQCRLEVSSCMTGNIEYDWMLLVKNIVCACKTIISEHTKMLSVRWIYVFMYVLLTR